MLAWLRDLTSQERKTMLACWGGWTLDGFDQQLALQLCRAVFYDHGFLLCHRDRFWVPSHQSA
jgi:hypothetical protein